MELLREHEDAVVILDYTLFDFIDEEQLLIVSERFAMTTWVLLSDEWSVQQNLAFPASNEQVQDKLHTNNPNIIKLLLAVGEKELSEKDCTSEHRTGVRVGL